MHYLYLFINSGFVILRPSILKTDDRGIRKALKILDSRLRENDTQTLFMQLMDLECARQMAFFGYHARGSRILNVVPLLLLSTEMLPP